MRVDSPFEQMRRNGRRLSTSWIGENSARILMNRGHFLRTSSPAGLALTATRGPTTSQSANDRIQVGIIGPGVRGMQLTRHCIEYGSE